MTLKRLEKHSENPASKRTVRHGRLCSKSPLAINSFRCGSGLAGASLAAQCREAPLRFMADGIPEISHSLCTIDGARRPYFFAPCRRCTTAIGRIDRQDCRTPCHTYYLRRGLAVSVGV